MKKLILLTILVFTALSCESQKSTQQLNSSVIENGLVPKLIIDAEPNTVYNILDRLKHYNVPGATVTAFENNEIIFSKGYGYKNADSKELVDKNTKFQVASLGKAVTAVATFRLIEKYNLDIDGDINQYLKDWQIDHPEYSATEKVTISRILRHTSGIKSFGGYLGQLPSEEIISIKDVLEGNVGYPKIELDRVPGSSMSYSSGAFAVLEYLIEEVSGIPFEEYMQKEVFIPLKMKNSTFNQFPKDNVSLAHTFDGKPNPNKWLVHSAASAGGLWTTSEDLSKFMITINKAYIGKKNTFLSQQVAKKMLETGKGWGLGVGLRGDDGNAMFFHGGSNPGGFCALMISGYKRGIGIVILDNSESGNPIRDEISGAFSKHYNFNHTEPKVYKTTALSKDELTKYIGTYHFKDRGEYYLKVSISGQNELILTDQTDGVIYTYIPIIGDKFLDKNEGTVSSFNGDPKSNKILSMNYNDDYTFYKID